jgi:hypothetical protein
VAGTRHALPAPALRRRRRMGPAGHWRDQAATPPRRARQGHASRTPPPSTSCATRSTLGGLSIDRVAGGLPSFAEDERDENTGANSERKEDEVLDQRGSEGTAAGVVELSSERLGNRLHLLLVKRGQM